MILNVLVLLEFNNINLFRIILHLDNPFLSILIQRKIVKILNGSAFSVSYARILRIVPSLVTIRKQKGRKKTCHLEFFKELMNMFADGENLDEEEIGT